MLTNLGESKGDTSTTTYAGAIAIGAILILALIRLGIVKGK